MVVGGGGGGGDDLRNKFNSNFSSINCISQFRFSQINFIAICVLLKELFEENVK